MTAADTRPARGPSRGALVAGLVGAAAVGVVAASLTWVSGSVTDPALGARAVALTGREAAPAALALCLVAGAAGLAAALTGRVARFVAAVVAVLAGAGVVWSALAVALDPAASLAGAGGTATTRVDPSTVSGAGITPWVVVAALAGTLAALLGLAICWYGRRWTGLSSRYERPTAHGAAQADDAAAAAADPDDPAAREAAEHRARREAAVADWDSLTRGDDPTE